MKKTDKAYIAGFLDADGSILLQKVGKTAYNKNHKITRW